ncbi:hypothetical protein BJV78DRAFT_1285895 [Lactifluus subvellereus]|nr:hypothetical protein BJV78DRAFT_1285895 [Lactifluus subvellereus]
MPKNSMDEKLPVLLSEHEPCAPPSSSSSTVSHFMGRLDARVRSMSSPHTVPSCQTSLRPYASNTYAKIKAPYDGEGSSTHDHQPHPRGVNLMSRSQHPSCSHLRHPPSFRRRQDERTASQDYLLHVAPPLSNIVGNFSQSTTVTNGNDGPGSGSRSSLNMLQSSSYSRVPFPSTSEESYPSAHSTDAIAVFQAPPDKSGVEGRRRHDCIFEDWVEIIFAVTVDETSTSSSATSVHTAPRPRGLVDPLRRRVRALASLLSTRCKFPTMFTKERRPPHLDDYDYNLVEYDIPCLAYISCLW